VFQQKLRGITEAVHSTIINRQYRMLGGRVLLPDFARCLGRHQSDDYNRLAGDGANL